jgi:hypothetical protein
MNHPDLPARFAGCAQRTHYPTLPLAARPGAPIGRRAVIALLLAASASTAQPQSAPVDLDQVCVTLGEIRTTTDGRLEIDSDASRAVSRQGDDDYAGLVFEYLGPSRTESKLASGNVKRQLGLKLQAEDSCNVVYVMWPVDGGPLEVSSKVNPGKVSHAECGVKGYVLSEARHKKPVAPIVVGQPRRLEARVENRVLQVLIDGEVVWSGDAGRRTGNLFGYSGLRTDNVHIRFKWLVEPDNDRPPPGKKRPPLACHAVQR